MFRTLPPTAAPIEFRDLLHGVTAIFSAGRTEAKFREQIRDYFKVKHVFLVSSGKAAIYLSLSALRQKSGRQEVIIPAYSSFCLASAVARSGLQVRLCDIDPETLDFDLAKLKVLISEKTLAVISVHHYGLVCNLREIQRLALAKGALVIEDAAQAAGATLDKLRVGAIGDVGILSVGRGKNLCALGGGGILTNKKWIAEFISGTLEQCQNPSRFSTTGSLAIGMALCFFLDPKRYVVPTSMPFLQLGANVFDPRFKIERLPKLNEAIGQMTFSRLDRYNKTRIQNARLIRKGLSSEGGLIFPKSYPNGRSVYLKFPVLFANKEERIKAFHALARQRLGANCSYPTPLNEICAFKKHLIGENDFPGSRFVANRILTLPTHPYVQENDIKRIISTVKNVKSARPVNCAGGKKSSSHFDKINNQN